MVIGHRPMQSPMYGHCCKAAISGQSAAGQQWCLFSKHACPHLRHLRIERPRYSANFAILLSASKTRAGEVNIVERWTQLRGGLIGDSYCRKTSKTRLASNVQIGEIALRCVNYSRFNKIATQANSIWQLEQGAVG